MYMLMLRVLNFCFNSLNPTYSAVELRLRRSRGTAVEKVSEAQSSFLLPSWTCMRVAS